MESQRLVYRFSEADDANPALFGGKGAGLARMMRAGLPVPPGFIISTEACRRFMERGRIPDSLTNEVAAALAELEQESGRCFGGGPVPLLVSVRSGAPISMPGMMDTVLNLGINEEAASALAEAANSLSFVGDIVTRFHRMYSEIVLAADGEFVVKAAAPVLADLGEHADARSLFRALWAALTAAEDEEVGATVPADPREQLHGAIRAVFESWNSRRAITYRRAHHIPDDLGTAVVVQTMVFGNLDAPSGSGVAFTRNPATGEPELYGEFLEGGQGEDVVAGTATPATISEARKRHPAIFDELSAQCRQLEELYRDVLDIEFTVERGHLYLLQVRSAKRTAEAAVRFAADFVREGELTAGEALAHVTPEHIRMTERPRFEEERLARARAAGDVLGQGIGASPGQVSGLAVLDPDRAEELARSGEAVILARPTTSPLDLHGMLASVGILTALGGATSHAAVVARALGKPCVVGCDDAQINLETRRFTIGGRTFEEGAAISIDGRSGEVFTGALPTAVAPASSADLDTVLGVARDASRCSVFGMGSTAQQAQAVRHRGGIGVATRIGDLLAMSDRLDELLERLLKQRNADVVDLSGFEEVVADVLVPFLDAFDGLHLTARALDLRAEEAIELLDTPNLLTALPSAALPLGVPELVRVQVAGLSSAAERVGLPEPPELTLRHLTDPEELVSLKQLADEELRRSAGRAPIRVGATITSPRGLQLLPELARVSDRLWLDVRRIQSAYFGYPPTVLLTGEPLDEYVRRGLLSSDPRLDADAAMAQLFSRLGVARIANPACRIGARLTGPVSEEMVGALYRVGCRVFAVDTTEVRAIDVALGKVALSEPGAIAPQNGR